MIQKAFNRPLRKRSLQALGMILISWSVVSCFSPSVPIRRNPKYDLDVFWENDKKPDRPFQVIDQVSIQEEMLLTEEQRKTRGPMVGRGNDARQKNRLTEMLVKKAEAMGANAVMDVKYKYYTTATSNGYIMEGTAVLYRGD
ncbi:heavy metal-binding domain-containing protein [Siphonobacter sp. SORGH_AS_1065]|uniref:heavy metal-binding domain-containing protein n=1 Tax=Siphonobacter sp. SORGH_AS_1065 TaxID=3041795 RepID=UPI0027840EDB|nr:heavy metal-binding domain-containing protein [Siphonobacter sp. SORGH_AS_1065]MDQ1088847.1 hypothetical protein [Siphonobacter sp. SORGH_AS_1065]